MEKEKVEKFIKNWIYAGIVLISVLAFWAGDWKSWKLLITLPLGIVAYFSVAIPAAYAGKMSKAVEPAKNKNNQN